MLRQPVSQVPLTNVVVVRYKTKGKKFEIACYPNKVNNWRAQIEKDIDEVVQFNEVYLNVQQGVIANKKELSRVFGNLPKPAVVRIILDKGELQVSELERKSQSESTLKDVATIIAEKCVDLTTGQPIPPSTIIRTLEQHHVNIRENQPAKKQALALIRAQGRGLGIVRAQMRIRLNFSAEADFAGIVTLLTVESRTENHLLCLINPEHFREIHLHIQKNELGEQLGLSVVDQFVRGKPVIEEAKEEPQVAQKVRKHNKFSCKDCLGAEFNDSGEQRCHFKSPWHRFNVKRKVREFECISYAEFSILSEEEVACVIARS